MVRINGDFDKKVIIQSDELEWKPSRYPGVSRRLLDRVGHIELEARCTSIVRYGAGSTVDKHTHGGGEEYIVLSGSFDDEHGHHSKGEYVRNPPTSEHTTHTEDGCEVFVKNWQMRLDGRSQVNVDLDDIDSVGVKGILFEDDGETIFVQDLAAGESLKSDTPVGAELFVISGNVRDVESGQVLREHAMMRTPAKGELEVVGEEGGGKVWVKLAPFFNTTGPRAATPEQSRPAPLLQISRSCSFASGRGSRQLSTQLSFSQNSGLHLCTSERTIHLPYTPIPVMEAPYSIAAPVAGRRARAPFFPFAFVELLYRALAARSDFIRDQLDCWGEAGAGFRLELPAEEGSLWLEGLLCTSAGLRATANDKLAQYLKAAEFFQDSELIHTLRNVLGGRLFKTQGANLSSEQSTTQREHPAEVLEVLSDDQAIEVLHSAPGSFEEQVIQLPAPFRSLAVLAHIQSLAATFRTSAAQDSGPCPDFPTLTLCVDTSKAQADLGIMAIAAPSSDSDAHASVALELAGSSMWPIAAEVNAENIANGLFSLQQRGSSIGCCLSARSHTLQNLTLELPDNCCLVFGPSSSAIHLKNVTFQGGAVVCTGSDCRPTFDDVVFERCSVVVLSGAQVTLNNPQFRDMGSSTAGLSIYAHGACTKVAVQGGSITAGTQGVTVQAGACVEASALTITRVEVVGVEVKDEGSSVKLSSCNLENFSSRFLRHSVGVRVRSQSSAHLSRLAISGMRSGVRVRTHASATLCDCTVADTVGACVLFADAATGRLEHCTLSRSMESQGLSVQDAGSRVHAANCHFLGSTGFCGAAVGGGGTLTADACTTSGHKAGYNVDGEGGVLELTNCSSHNDFRGCQVIRGGQLTARNVVMSNNEEFGFAAFRGGSAVLDACTLQQNGRAGAFACVDAVVEVRGCSSRGNGVGYVAQTGARMTVTNSSSDGDGKGCSVILGGQVTMEGVTVDGVSQSGKLHSHAWHSLVTLPVQRHRSESS